MPAAHQVHGQAAVFTKSEGTSQTFLGIQQRGCSLQQLHALATGPQVKLAPALRRRRETQLGVTGVQPRMQLPVSELHAASEMYAITLRTLSASALTTG
jgi:hypothetical protein